MTDGNVINFKSEMYQNFSMTSMEAREWLNSMPTNDPLVLETISKIAAGEYPRILDELDQFIKIISRSKHNENGGALRIFSDSMNFETMLRISLRKHDVSIVRVLFGNFSWQTHILLAEKRLDYETWRSSRAAAKQKRLRR